MDVPDPMSDEELERIEQLCRSATRGPWKAFVEGRDHESGSSFIRTGADDIEMSGASEADYDFIANARQDAPRLLREIRVLRTMLGGPDGAKHELPVPGPAQQDDAARELIRVWAAAGAQHVTLATGLWRDPAAWGIVLADLARHVARAYEQTEGMSQADVLKRIRVALDAEWGHPTDEPTGGSVS